MALSKSVVKKAVTGNQAGINVIVFTLTITDTTGPGFVQDFSCEYRTGDNVANKVADITEQMQGAINDYKRQQQIFNSAALNTAITNISGGLVL